MRGQRRHRLTIYRRTSNASDTQFDEATDEAVATVWAALKPKGGDETTQGERRRGKEAFLISFRWAPAVEGINSGWWLEKGERGEPGYRRWNFLSVANVEERNRMVEVEAVEA